MYNVNADVSIPLDFKSLKLTNEIKIGSGKEKEKENLEEMTDDELISRFANQHSIGQWFYSLTNSNSNSNSE